MMKLGISSLYMIKSSFKEVENTIMSSNVKNWEVVDEWRIRLNEKRAHSLLELKKSFGLRFTVHAPFLDINLASLNSSVKRLMLKRLKRSIQLSGKIEADVWTVHPGMKSGLSWAYPTAHHDSFISSIHELSKFAKDVGVKISIENTPNIPSCFMKNSEEIRRFSEELDEEVGITLDLGHANTVGESLEKFIETVSKRLVLIHAHDNDGSYDQHREIGKGNIDWKAVMRKLSDIRYDGVIIIEDIEAPMKSLEKLRSILSQLKS